MTKRFNNLVCSACGSDLEISINIVGGDWNSEAGEGSGFDNALHLDCTKYGCGRTYIIGYLKSENAFSLPKNLGSSDLLEEDIVRVEK